MISTKGRYALRVMLDLAEHGNEGYIPLKILQRDRLFPINIWKVS